jgi:drug/metabolite transporter (DMT)-like permease
VVGTPYTTPSFQASHQTPLLGTILLVVGAGLLTANDALIKIAINSHALGQVMLIRSVFSMLTVLVCLPLLGGWQNLRIKSGRGVTLCAGLLVVSVLIFPISMRYLPLADAIILAYTSPLWVIILAPVLIRERTWWPQWLAVALGFFGACLVVKPGFGMHWAVTLPLFVALLVGLRDIVTRRIAATENPIAILALANLMAMLIAAVLAPFNWQPMLPSMWGVLAGAGVLFAVSQVIIVMAFRYAEAAVLSTLKYSAILFAVLYGYGLWGDLPDLLALVGAACIILSGIAIIRFRRTPAEP